MRIYYLLSAVFFSPIALASSLPDPVKNPEGFKSELRAMHSQCQSLPGQKDRERCQVKMRSEYNSATLNGQRKVITKNKPDMTSFRERLSK
ncbi:MAG: hypothetical protein IBX55_01655 [Methyloprofundus sp.]|nr:hypothetical protein [Methyloprofundus sp.]